MVNTCHQYLIREKSKENTEYNEIIKNIDTDLKKSTIEETSFEIAEKIIIRYEWLGTLPYCSKYFGIFFNNICGGVACISVGTGGNGVSTNKMYGVEKNELAYLVRGACAFWTKKNTASYFISKVINQLDEKIKVIYAYSDIEAGEIGTIYQALGWLCLGKPKSKSFVLRNKITGDIFRDAIITTYKKKNNISYSEMKKYLLNNDFEMIQKESKIRYCKILTKDKKEYDRIYNKIKHLITKYPKR